MNIFARLACAVAAFTFAFGSTPVRAQSNADVDAAARSVVRIVVVGSDSENGEPNIGMGSGVAVTPTRIVTNAHVVESIANGSGFVGIVPSEGRKRFTGKVVAYSAALDLAVIALQNGSITPAALYGGAISDGTAVTAIGYPFAVDRAMATGVEDVIRPQSPVKSLGNVGGKRTNERFATVVHTAAIGRGNSGGPLVDSCGRVVGINSFLSVSEGVDSTFAFALAVPELTGFLAKAGIEPRVTSAPCLTSEQAAARNAALDRADEETAARDARRAEADAANMATAKQRIRDDIATERENRLALSAFLFGLGIVGAAWGVVVLGRRTAKQRRGGWLLLGLAVALVLASGFAFLTRPKFDEVDDRYAAANPAKAPKIVTASAPTTGAQICALDAERSRVTVSETADVPLDWADSGCVNGKTQYGANAGTWSRTFVSNTESAVTIQSYDPTKARYSVERFLLPVEIMDKARAVRAGYNNNACTSDPAQRQSVADMETAVRALLPEAPNERLVYNCRRTAKPPVE